MADPRHLARAPIREAVIDIQVVPVSIDSVLALRKSSLASRGDCNQLWQSEIGIEVIGNGQSTARSSDSALGVRFDLKDDHQVVAFKTTGFSFSQLAPYSSWEEVQACAAPIWDEYINQVKSPLTTRLAVRYINDIRIALPISDFGEYLCSAPIVPPKLPQALASFLQQFVINNENRQCAAVVTQALEPYQISEKEISVLLDIDVIKSIEVSTSSLDIWSILTDLRDFKNEIFFDFLQEKTLELFQ